MLLESHLMAGMGHYQNLLLSLRYTIDCVLLESHLMAGMGHYQNLLLSLRYTIDCVLLESQLMAGMGHYQNPILSLRCRCRQNCGYEIKYFGSGSGSTISNNF